MLSGEFQRKLKSLNRELRIWCSDNDHLPAGLFRVVNGEYEQICSVDKQWVGEHTEFHPNGMIKRSGWRRVLRLLIQLRYIDRRQAEKVFQTHLPYATRKLRPPVKKIRSLEEVAEDLNVQIGKVSKGRIYG